MPEGEATNSKTNRKGIPTIRWLIPCVVIGLLAVGYLLATRSDGPQTKFEWMSFQQMGRAVQPGPLQRLKFKLVSLAGPLLRWYKPNRPNISITVDLVGVPPQWEATSGIGSPFSTNQDGTKAWILEENGFRTVRTKIKAANGAETINVASVTTRDGRQAQVATIQMATVVSTNGSTSPFPVGMTVDVDPKVVGHSIRLVLGVTSTETLTATNVVSTIRTNVAVCSRVFLSNGGGLVLSAGRKDSGASTNLWILISTTATDSKGVKIKL